MSSPDKPSGNSLKNLHQQRKNQHHAPASIKRAVIARHQSAINTQRLWKRIGHVTVAASTLLLCGLVYWHHYVWQVDEPNVASTQYTTVELHSLAPNKQSADISERYASHYQAYLSRQQVLVMHHKKQAVLRHNEGDWQLQTCDQQLVKVSQDLINALRNIRQIDEDIKHGDQVELRFDKNGIILGISQSKTYMHC